MVHKETIPGPIPKPPARRFPSCGMLSIAAPFLGYVALELILPRFEDGRHWSFRLFLDGGPTWLQKIAYTIMGTAGVIGLICGGLAWVRSENRALAIVGLLLNGPLILLLIDGLPMFLEIVPELLDPANRKILPMPG